jgi:hypothetical protein
MRHVYRLSLVLAVGGTALAGCGHAGIPGVDRGRVKDVDRWETVLMKAYTHPETCGAGPWEIVLPERDVRWGRQIVIQVRGPRKIPISWEVSMEGSTWKTRGGARVNPDLHSRCRVPGGGDDAVASMEAEQVASTEDSVEGSLEAEPAQVEGDAEPSGELAAGSSLTLMTRIQARRTTQHAWGVAIYPHGQPVREDGFANEGFRLQRWTARSQTEANAQVTIRVWLDHPSDLGGIELVFRDQELVPDRSRISSEEYARTFPVRVNAFDASWEDKRRASDERNARAVAERERLCRRDPSHWRCADYTMRPPPEPIAERRPEAPPISAGVKVRWIPGYWRFDASVEGEYVWVPGTYVTEVTGRPKEETPPPATIDEGQTHEVAADMPPPPPARDEAIPPPPAIDGAVWVAGHYRIAGNAWVWVPGTWQVPPTRGARRTTPRVEVRGSVRIFIPGGWVVER